MLYSVDFSGLNESKYFALMEKMLAAADCISLHITDIFGFYAFYPEARGDLIKRLTSYDEFPDYLFKPAEWLKRFVLGFDPSRNRVTVGESVADDLGIYCGETCILCSVTHERLFHSCGDWAEIIKEYKNNGSPQLP